MQNQFAYIDAQSDLSSLVRMSPVEMFDLDSGNVAIEWRTEAFFPVPLLNVRDDLISTYSDLHKDVYGCRPRMIADASNNTLREAISQLQAQIEIDLAREAREEQAHIAATHSAMTPKRFTIGDVIRW